jgi:hypothetical protein
MPHSAECSLNDGHYSQQTPIDDYSRARVGLRESTGKCHCSSFARDLMMQQDGLGCCLIIDETTAD